MKFAALALLLTTLCAAAQERRPHITAEQVDKAVAALDALAAKQTSVPGLAIAVVFRDKVVYAKGFGVRDINGKAPVNADTVFQLASVSKPIGATVVAALIGDGKDHLGFPAQRARSHLRHVRSVGYPRGHHPRHVRASKRSAGSRR